MNRDIHLVPNSYYPVENLEYPMVGDLTIITPNDLFYVRNHFEYPKVDLDNWALQIEGLVNRPLSFTYTDIKKERFAEWS
ncbi:molybdopterin-dependent oxidoreductase, partial [Alicyclobacillus acidoterrestris]